jgi:hypothetical protein
LESVLEIFINWPTPETRRFFFVAEQKFREFCEESGHPAGKQEWNRALEAILDECRRLHVRYPKAFLFQKAQIQRGQFLPRAPQPEAPPIFAAMVGCIHCGREFTNLRQFEHPRIHQCTYLDRLQWDSQRNPRKVPAARAQDEKKKEA